MKKREIIEISEAKIQYVSLVDKAANKRHFLVAKCGGEEGDFSRYGKIIKLDCEAHYITGIVYEPFVEDSQGNFMSCEEIRKAAYWFAKNGDKVDLQHSFESANGLAVVENYIAPCDMQIGGECVREGSWLITVEVRNDEVWQSVCDKKITGFSMGGFGKYSKREMPMELPHSPVACADCGCETDFKTNSDSDSSGGREGFIKKLAAFFGLNQNAAQGKEVVDMSEQEVEALIDEKVNAAVTKAFDGLADSEFEKSLNSLIEKSLGSSIEKAIDSALTPLLKARGNTTNLNSENAPMKKSGHFLAGIL